MIDYTSLEHPSFRVPYEELNRMYRNGHKNIEKSVTKLNKVGGAIKQKLANNQESIPVDSVRKAYAAFCEHVEEIQQVFSETTKNEMSQTRKMLSRIITLREECNVDESSRPKLHNIHRRYRTARYSIWFLLRSGMLDTARAMIKAYGMEDMVDIEVFEQCKAVENALLERNVTPCLEWIETHRSKLKKMNSPLEIVIRKQNMISLRKEGKIMEAMTYLKKQIVPIASDHHHELQNIMALMAIAPFTQIEKYDEMMSDTRWSKCAELFVSEVCRMYHLSVQSAFSICLQAGLSAFKTPSCRCDPRPPEQVDCIVCKKNIWPIADGLPHAHVSVSAILCSVSGEACDDKNHAFLLPSGHVVGQSGIEQIRHGDVITCPHSGTTIPVSDLERLYFL